MQLEQPLVHQSAANASAPRVLIVEDNEQALDVIHATLSEYGYETERASSIRVANRLLEAHAFDLVILDIGLPDGSGLDLCTHIHLHRGTPVIIVSAAGTPEERIAGFDAGADDYVPKPLHPIELLRRVDAVLRRAGFDPSRAVLTGPHDLQLDIRTGLARYRGQQAVLTRSEAAILRVLIEGAGTAQSTEDLIRRVWNYQDIGESNFLHQHMSRLRRKLDGIGYPREAIRTVYGIGYALMGVESAAEESSP